jgi:hypothetical protein
MFKKASDCPSVGRSGREEVFSKNLCRLIGVG